jgi:hypothetical protein
MLAIAESLRRIIARHVITESPLTADASAGDDTITVRTTNRFAKGHQVLIKNDADDPDVENGLTIAEIVDKNTIRLTAPLAFDWTVAAGCSVMKTIRGNYVRAVMLGEPEVFPQNMLPAITVRAKGSNSAFFTTRATKERYTFEIGVFVEAASQEDSEILMLELADMVQKGLKKNVYPLVSDYESVEVTQDIAVGDYFVKVADTSIFVPGHITLVEDQYKMFENHVNGVCDATTLRLETAFQESYLAGETHLIRPNRFIFNSWPSDIQPGTIYKGTLLKAAAITWFGEEMEIQFNQPWSDTQLK